MDAFSQEGASLAALITLRVTGMVWIAPVFASKSVSAGVKTGFTVLMVVLLWPVVNRPVPIVLDATAVLSELLIGLSLGLCAAIFIAAAESAGDMIAVQMGLSGANVLDPMSHTQVPVVGQFLSLFVLALLLSVGGHLVMIQTVGSSFDVLPIGSPIDGREGILATVELGSTLLWLGLRFAAPVVAAMMIGNVGLGILARTVPQLNLLTVAFPLQIGIGLIALGASLPMIVQTMAGWNETYGAMSAGLLEALQPDAVQPNGVR